MLKSVDILTVDNPYNSTYIFSLGIKKAFEDFGFFTRLLSFNEDKQASSLDCLLSCKPDLLFSFNHIFMRSDSFDNNESHSKKKQDIFLSSFLQVPEFTYLIDSPIYAMNLFEEPLNFASVIDKNDYEGLKSLNKNILFLPHGVEKGSELKKEKKTFDIVMTATFLDFEKRRLSWPSRFDKETASFLEKAYLEAIHDKSKPIIVPFSSSFQGRFKYPYNDLYYELEYCIKGQDRYELLMELSDYSIDVFGAGTELFTSRNYLKDLSHVRYHPPLDYKKSLELYTKAKVILNSSPQFSNGSHERIFNALLSFASVVTNFNPFIYQEFNEDKGVIYFGPLKEKGRLKEEVKKALGHDQNVKKAIEEGYNILMQKHTWHNRVEEIISFFYKHFSH
jgi:hypothetical protein